MTNGNATQVFDALFVAHRRVLYAYLLGQVGNREGAEDLLQETFVRVWRHIEEARAVPSERQRLWLFAIAKNLSRDYHRRSVVRERVEATSTTPQIVPDPQRVVEARETAARLDTAICDLPKDLRTVLVLHVLGDLTSAEVGQLLNRPAGTVRYQLSQARKRLAEALT